MIFTQYSVAHCFLLYMISWCNIVQETRKQQFIRGCDVIDRLPQSDSTVSILFNGIYIY
jgi:hypothetical protein